MKKILFILLTITFFQLQAQITPYNCFFQFNSAKYHADSITKLERWLPIDNSSSKVGFKLLAYTDTNGSVTYNDVLAEKRLEDIVLILKEKGFQIIDSRAIGKRYSTDNYTKNSEFRKVEILVFSSETQASSELPELILPEKQIDIITIDSIKPKKTLLEEFEEMGNNTIINLNIEFQNGTNLYISEESEQQVFYLAQYLKKYPEKKVMILGHVCCTSNQAISVSRARKVYDDLVNYKISKNRMKFQGMSNSAPLVPEINAKAEQQNRRVEVVFYE